MSASGSEATGRASREVCEWIIGAAGRMGEPAGCEIPAHRVINWQGGGGGLELVFSA